MTRTKLIELLKTVTASMGDREIAHSLADELLLKYINDKEVEAAYNDIPKWYA